MKKSLMKSASALLFSATLALTGCLDSGSSGSSSSELKGLDGNWFGTMETQDFDIIRLATQASNGKITGISYDDMNWGETGSAQSLGHGAYTYSLNDGTVGFFFMASDEQSLMMVSPYLDVALLEKNSSWVSTRNLNDLEGSWTGSGYMGRTAPTEVYRYDANLLCSSQGECELKMQGQIETLDGRPAPNVPVVDSDGRVVEYNDLSEIQVLVSAEHGERNLFDARVLTSTGHDMIGTLLVSNQNQSLVMRSCTSIQGNWSCDHVFLERD